HFGNRAQISIEMIIVLAAIIGIVSIILVNLVNTANEGKEVLDKKTDKVVELIKNL
ncbi:MAG: class III signal peptide-containing protein, partial [Candidatus Diapherotrites archaeon]|nr:class III signal peptide-containing protein [Candidatus Diapherotrites archaeon]